LASTINPGDNHFGALMLSLDAKDLGYSALIQVIKAKTNQGFVANVAASVNKQRHSQPPVGGKVTISPAISHATRFLTTT